MADFCIKIQKYITLHINYFPFHLSTAKRLNFTIQLGVFILDKRFSISITHYSPQLDFVNRFQYMFPAQVSLLSGQDRQKNSLSFPKPKEKQQMNQ